LTIKRLDLRRLAPQRISPAIYAALIVFLINVIFEIQNVIFTDQFRALSSANPLTLSVFGDDRDGWLAAAASFAHFHMSTYAWQVNFWPPGNIGILTLGYFVTRSLYGAALFHIVIELVGVSLLIFEFASWLVLARINRYLVLGLSILFAFSFTNSSSLSRYPLSSDYLAATFGTFAISYFLRRVVVERRYTISSWAIPGVTLAFAGYTRIFYYQLFLIGLLVILSYFIFIRIQKMAMTARVTSDFERRNQETGRRNKEIFRKLTLSLIVVSILFAPWIAIRSFIIYPGNIVKGIQMSSQGRFALELQWVRKDVADFRILQLMGLGTACKLDPVKCNFFANRDLAAKNGNSVITMDDDWDQKASAAIRVFIKHPLAWASLKLPSMYRAYFQRSAFDSVDTKVHLSLDRILILILFVANFLNSIFLWARRRLVVPIVLFSLSAFLIGQLLITQTVFRVFLPGMLMILLNSTSNAYFLRTQPALR